MRFTNPILLLDTASMAFAFDAVISKGLWIGTDSTNPGASLEEIFAHRRNHVTAVSTILQMYSLNSDFIPWKRTPQNGRHSYGSFKFMLENSPIFQKVETFTAQMFVSGDLYELQTAIRQEYKHQDRELVAFNLASSIPTKSRNLVGTHLVLFSLVEIFKPRTQEAVHVRLIELPLGLRVDKGDVRLYNQDAKLTALTFEIKTKWVKEHAHEIASSYLGLPITVKEFVQIFTTSAEDENEDEDEDDLS
ncbi:hypothetical protein DFQ27_001974 [Actinomortierella ambigua]|uniref:Uncharacterized protein n=1 Tax=Actinomortierella ambigua TaxID=1343610 RepID=A0A9P6Q8L9_9FUNG|nr:hypothetical protein DFQ27_001974 [Actinomortierella ambigua]